jgi:flavin-dependent dehydrogenase
LTVDVAVVGGGPAGATAARLLAEWGYQVVLFARPKAPRPPLAESLPPSIVKVLAAVGALGWVEEAGFLRTSGNTSWWSHEEARVESFGPGAMGFQVLRADLEALLLRAAQGVGVHVRTQATVRRVEVDGPEGVRLEVAPVGGSVERLAARFVLDASGRVGVLGRRGRLKGGLPTLALSAVWHHAGGFPLPDDTHTLVEAYADGWAWSIPVARGVRHVTVMIDPRRSRERRGQARLYEEELAKSARLRSLVARAERRGPPFGADASTYLFGVLNGPRFALVGDAASFIDPLSSYGVKKALFSAWLAAIATHTGLRHPERAEMARGFLAERERQMYWSSARESALHAAKVAARHPSSPFWQARARDVVGEDGGEPEDLELAAPTELRTAAETLKRSPSPRLRAAEGARVELRPAVLGREIALATVVVAPNGRATRFVEGVNAASLLRLAEQSAEVPMLYEAYNRAAPPVGLPEFLRAICVLMATGLLRHVPCPVREGGRVLH